MWSLLSRGGVSFFGSVVCDVCCSCADIVVQEPSLTTWLPLHCPTLTCGSTLGTRNIRSVIREEDPNSPDAAMEGEQLVETWRLDKYAVEFLGAEENRYDTL